MAKRKKKKKTESSAAVESPQVDKKDKTPDEFSDPQYLVNYVVNAKKEDEKASKERRTKWEELWLLYQNKQDYTAKKSWQSKIFSPKIFMHTIRAAALVERAAFQTSTLFKVEPDKEYYEEEQLEEMTEKATKVEKKLKNHLEKTNFAECLGENSISGFLLGMGAVKRRWDDDEPKATYDNIDVLNLFISPDYKPFTQPRPKHIIERSVVDMADLLDDYRKNPDVWIADAVEKLEASYATKQEIKTKERTRKGLSDYSPQDKQIEKLEFWGDIISKDGKHILRNQVLIVANGSELIRHHENPFNDGLPPYRLSIPIVYPHRGIAGTSLVEGAVPLQYTLNNILNLYMDNLNFTVNKMFEMNKGALVDAQKARRIYPGKVFLTQTSDRQAVREITTTAIGQEVINAIKVVDGELRQATAISEYVEALPSKHKQTLGEIEKKTAESHGFFDVIARRLERNLIAKLIEDTFNLMRQFSSVLKDLEGKYLFKVGGLTLILQQEKLKQQIAEILGAALKSEVLASMTDIPLLYRKWLAQASLQDVFKEPEEEQIPPEEKARQDVQGLPPEGQIALLRKIQGSAA